MTLIFNPQLENAYLNTVRDAIDSGDTPGTLDILEGSTVLASLPLSPQSFSDELGGISSANPVTSAQAVLSGVADGFAFKTSYGATVFTGDIPGDLDIGGTTIVPGLTISVSSFTLTEGVVQEREFASTVAYPYEAAPGPMLWEGPTRWTEDSVANPISFTPSVSGDPQTGYEAEGDSFSTELRLIDVGDWYLDFAGEEVTLSAEVSFQDPLQDLDVWVQYGSDATPPAPGANPIFEVSGEGEGVRSWVFTMPTITTGQNFYLFMRLSDATSFWVHNLSLEVGT